MRVGRAYPLAAPFGRRCLTGPALLRFQTPLIEPDVRISRIRLSEKASRSRPREVGRPSGQADQAQHVVQVPVRPRPRARTPHLVLDAQPLTQPLPDVGIKRPVGRADGPIPSSEIRD